MILKPIKPYVAKRKEELRKAIAECTSIPQLAIIQVGDKEASNRYIKNKIKDCKEVGIIAHWYNYPEDITTEGLIEEIQDLQDHYDGIIVQMPLPAQIDNKAITLAIDPGKDVDGFHPLSEFMAATPKGIMDYLDLECGWEFSGKHVVIIGRSSIVGRPLAEYMTNRDATVTLCHSRTKNLHKFIYDCDLIVSAVGQAGFLNCYPIHVPVIDVGINFNDEGKLVGDCINTDDRDVTPVPGGVGLLTRLALLENVYRAKKN